MMEIMNGDMMEIMNDDDIMEIMNDDDMMEILNDDMMEIMNNKLNIVTSITRLGQRNESKSRPIKVKLSSQNEKQMVMSNLIKLKNQFKKLSVTDDYTIEERAVIRKKVAEARHKTETITLSKMKEL